MNVDDPPRKRLQHRRFEHAHKTGENDQLDPRIAQHPDEFLLSLRLQPRPELARRQKGAWHRELACDVEDRSLEHIGNHNARLGRKFARTNLIQNRAAIAPFPGAENPDGQFTHDRAISSATAWWNIPVQME